MSRPPFMGMRICDVLPTPGFAVNDTLSRRQLVMLTSFLLFVMVSASASGSEPNSSELSSDASFSLPRVNAGASGFIDITLPDELGVIWETKTAEAIETTPVVDQGRVFVADVMGGVEALELQSGKSLWRRDFDTGFVASPTILSASSVTHHPDRLVVLETDKDDATPDGQRRTVDGNQIDKWDRIIASDRLLLGDVEGNVWSLDPATGQTQWQIAIEAEIDAAVAFFVLVADEQPQVQLLVTSQDGNLRCLNAENGELIWTYATGDQIRCGASIAQGKTFLGGCDGGLHIVDLTTGKAVGEPLPLGGPTGSTPATESGPVFVPIMDGVVYRFDLDSDSQDATWTFEDEQLQEFRGDAAIADDFIIVASRNKQVFGLGRDSGKRRWVTTLRRRPDASPIIAGDDVWIASSDGRLSRLSLTSGDELWSYEIRGSWIAAPAIVPGHLIIADDDGVVRCFGLAS